MVYVLQFERLGLKLKNINNIQFISLQIATTILRNSLEKSSFLWFEEIEILSVIFNLNIDKKAEDATLLTHSSLNIIEWSYWIKHHVIEFT